MARPLPTRSGFVKSKVFSIHFCSIFMTKSEYDPLTLIYFQCHEIVMEIVKTDKGIYPRNYKRFEKKRIEKYFRNISYKSKSINDFTTEMMSNLIVIHGLPNTNHRSTILFIGLVLEELDVRFPPYKLDSRGKKKWIDECNRYITKSKRILYTRKRDKGYNEKHLKWTKEWLSEIIKDQSNSSGMMSRNLLTTLRNTSSSGDFSSVIVKK